MTIEYVADCENCHGRMFEASGHGIFHAETGSQTCPKRYDPKELKRIIEAIIERDSELLKRLAD